MEDINSYLTFEVKKEIAERYFGFRKLIEEDTQQYLQNIVASSLELETKIGHDLVRIYTLLRDPDLIETFIKLTGLPDRFFIDSHINFAPDSNKIFSQQKARGFTRKGCLRNMVFDTYRSLFKHILEYRSVIEKLADDHETIRQQINLFYRKNDITSILQFLRSLESSSLGQSALATTATAPSQLEKNIKIEPPLPVIDLLPDIPEIPAEREIRDDLKQLIIQTCARQPQLDIRQLVS